MISKLSRAKSWLHIQDFEIDAAFKMGFLPEKVLSHLVKQIEKIIMKKFDRVSSISEKMLKRLINDKINFKKCVFFPNWVDTEKIFPLFERTLFRKEWGVDDDTFIVLYSGNMGEKQGLEIIIETASKLADDQYILFILCGNGSARNRLFRMADGIKNIHFLPIQPIDRFNQLLNTADIHLLPQKDIAVEMVLPSKLTGILASGGLVITNAKKDTELAKVVLEAGGMVFNSEDSSELSKLIKYISKNRSLNLEKKIKARNYAESNFSKEKILNNFYNELKILCKIRF